METKVDEIAPDIFRLSTWVPDVSPDGFTFNQFLIRDEQPFLFHAGMRQLYPLVSAALQTLIPLETLRWIAFAHIEADECGAMNLLLADAPKRGRTRPAGVHGLPQRPRRPAAARDRRRAVGHRRTPAAVHPHPARPHNWESGLWHEETSNTLLAGDLFTHTGNPAAIIDGDVIGPSMAAEDLFHATSMSENLEPTLLQLAELEPTTLAMMHGSSFHGDGGAQLRSLAAAYADARSA